MPKNKKYDFCGWATKNDLPCSDGRTIKANAFSAQDGAEVPLVWQHDHSSPDLVLGHAVLENRPEGVFTYGYLNESPMGKRAKELLKNQDIKSLSIYANGLKQQGGNVLHGVIREVSLVLSGANPGAVITDVAIAHGDSVSIVEDEFIYEVGEDNVELTLQHASKDDDADDEEGDKMKDTEKKESKAEETKKEAKEPEDSEETVGDVLKTFNEKQRKVMEVLIGKAIEDTKNGELDDDDEEDEEEDVEHSGLGEDDMQYNVFENKGANKASVSKEEFETLMHDAFKDVNKYGGSLKESFLAHAAQYGMENIGVLFPDAKNISSTPDFIARQQNWVTEFLNFVHKTPFSRIKSTFANITADEARARGFVKGNKKVNEVFQLLKRTTTPFTIYKKQQLDRDDVLDITDFDVVMWLKGEMQLMINEEIARAGLFGDGREDLASEKIDETKIRPVAKDADLFSLKYNFEGTGEAAAKAFIVAHVKAMANYRGQGEIKMFIRQSMLTELLLLTDTMGRDLYENVDKLAIKLQVSKIVPVPDEVCGKVTSVTLGGQGYNIGSDKGGSLNMFDDFDLNYNQMQYLLEGRCSGAMTVPYGAIVLANKADQPYTAVPGSYDISKKTGEIVNKGVEQS
nr:MAG TPA: major capsid protein [Caudoviricetes sp.]